MFDLCSQLWGFGLWLFSWEAQIISSRAPSHPAHIPVSSPLIEPFLDAPKESSSYICWTTNSLRGLNKKGRSVAVCMGEIRWPSSNLKLQWCKDFKQLHQFQWPPVLSWYIWQGIPIDLHLLRWGTSRRFPSIFTYMILHLEHDPVCK